MHWVAVEHGSRSCEKHSGKTCSPRAGRGSGLGTGWTGRPCVSQLGAAWSAAPGAGAWASMPSTSEVLLYLLPARSSQRSLDLEGAKEGSRCLWKRNRAEGPPWDLLGPSYSISSSCAVHPCR